LFAIAMAAGGNAVPAPAQTLTVPDAPDCLAEAASYHQVNEWVLRAIIWQESRNHPNAVGHNTNGSIDVGYGQINSIHFRELGMYQIPPNRLFDSCVNTYVAAWLLAKAVKKHGNTWEAVGAYHSESAAEKWSYSNKVRAILRSWGVPA